MRSYMCIWTRESFLCPLARPLFVYTVSTDSWPLSSGFQSVVALVTCTELNLNVCVHDFFYIPKSSIIVASSRSVGRSHGSCSVITIFQVLSQGFYRLLTLCFTNLDIITNIIPWGEPSFIYRKSSCWRCFTIAGTLRYSMPKELTGFGINF